MIRLSVIAPIMMAGAWVASGASFTQCPAVGVDTLGCELLITVGSQTGGAATSWTVTTASPDQGPYDGAEDTLIGIINNTNALLVSISFNALVGGDGVFDFDGDGACTFISCPGGSDSTGYGHGAVAGLVAVTFSNLGGTLFSSGTVNFGGGGIAVGGSNWFDLEGPIAASQLTGTTPEPSSLVLLGSGLLGMLVLARRKLVK